MMVHYKAQLHPCNRHYQASRFPPSSPGNVSAFPAVVALRASKYSNTAAASLARGGSVPTRVRYQQCPSHALSAANASTPIGQHRFASRFGASSCGGVRVEQLYNGDGRPARLRVSPADIDADGISGTRLWPLAPALFVRPAGRVLQIPAPLELPSASRMPIRFDVSHVVVSSGLLNLVLEGHDCNGANVRLPLPLPLPSQLRLHPTDRASANGAGDRASTGLDAASVASTLRSSNSNSDGGISYSNQYNSTENSGRCSFAAVDKPTVPTASQSQPAARTAETDGRPSKPWEQVQAPQLQHHQPMQTQRCDEASNPQEPLTHVPNMPTAPSSSVLLIESCPTGAALTASGHASAQGHTAFAAGAAAAARTYRNQPLKTPTVQSSSSSSPGKVSGHRAGRKGRAAASEGASAGAAKATVLAEVAKKLRSQTGSSKGGSLLPALPASASSLGPSPRASLRPYPGRSKLSVRRSGGGGGDGDGDGDGVNAAGVDDMLLLSRPDPPSLSRLLAGFRPTRLVRRSGTLYVSPPKRQQQQRRTQGPTEADHTPGVSPVAQEGRGYKAGEEDGSQGKMQRQEVSPLLQLLRTATPWPEVSPGLSSSATASAREETAPGSFPRSGSLTHHAATTPRRAQRQEGLGSHIGTRSGGRVFPGNVPQATPTGLLSGGRSGSSPRAVSDRGSAVAGRGEGGTRSSQRRRASAFRPTVMVSRRGSVSVFTAAAEAYKAVEEGILAVSGAAWRKWDGALQPVRHLAGGAIQASQKHSGGPRSMAEVKMQSEPSRDAGMEPDSTGASSSRGPVPKVLLQILRASNPRGATVAIAPGRQPAPMDRGPVVTTEPGSPSASAEGARPSLAAAEAKATATAGVPPAVGRIATERIPEARPANAVASSTTSDSAAAPAPAPEALPDATSSAFLQRERKSGSFEVAAGSCSDVETSILTVMSLERLYDILDEHMDALEPRAIILACRMMVGLILQGGLTAPAIAGSPAAAVAALWTSPANGAVHCYASAMDYHHGIYRRAGVSVGAPGAAAGADMVYNSRVGQNGSVKAAATIHQHGKKAPGEDDGKQGPAGRYPWFRSPGPTSSSSTSSEASGCRDPSPNSYEQELLSKARRRVGRLARRAAAVIGKDLDVSDSGLQRLSEASGIEPPELPVFDRHAMTEMSLGVLWAYGHLADPEDRLDLGLESDVGVHIVTDVGRAAGSSTWAGRQLDGKRGWQKGLAAGPAAPGVAVDTPVAAVGATRLPFRSAMSRLWRVALSELGALEHQHGVLRHPDPSQPSNRTTTGRSPHSQMWTMRALWAADRGAPSLLPGVLLVLASRFPERPPVWRKSLLQHQTQQPSPIASGSEQTGAGGGAGSGADRMWVVEAADEGRGGGCGDDGGSRSWPGLDLLSVGQLVSVLWACGRYALWLQGRSSFSFQGRQDQVAGFEVLERWRRTFAAKLDAPKGGNGGGDCGDGRRGDMARAAAQLVGSVAAAALRLLVARIAAQPRTIPGTVPETISGLLQQQQAAPHQLRNRKQPSDRLLEQRQQQQHQGREKPSVMAAVTSVATISGHPGAPITRQDLLAALEGATMVLEGTVHQDQALTLLEALSVHPAMRLQDITATLHLLRCWLPAEATTSGHSCAQPQEMLPLQPTAPAPPQHSHKREDGDASPRSAPATHIGTSELPAPSPGGARRPAAAAASAVSAGVAMSGQSSERKVETAAEDRLLQLEAAVLRLLGAMSGDQAQEMLRVQNLSSRGLRPRRGWYRTHLRLPPFVAEPSQQHQQQRQTQLQQDELQHGLCKSMRPGSRDGSSQHPSASHEAVSLGPAQRRNWTGSGQRRRMRLIRRLEHPLPFRLRLLYCLGLREGAGIETRGRPSSAWEVQSSGRASPCRSITSGTVGGPHRREGGEGGLAMTAAAGRASSGEGVSRPLRSLELQLLHQRRLYEGEDVRRYGTSDLLDLLAALGGLVKAGLPPRAATVRCVLNALALRWLRSGVVQRDVRVLIATLFRLGWRPRTVVTIFTNAWRPFVVLEPGSVSDTAVAGMAQVLGCLTSHDFAYHPGGRDAAAAEGGMAWPKLRRFWVNLVALASARMKVAGLQLLNGTVMHLPGSPGDDSNVSLKPVVPERQTERSLALSDGIANDGGHDFVRSVSPAIGTVDDCQAALLLRPTSPRSLPALSVRSLVRLVWSSGRQGARVPELLGTACQLLLPHLPQLLPGAVGALAWGLGQPQFCLPRMNVALLKLLRRWLAAAEDDNWGQGDAGGGGNWTAACRVATALLRLRHISPTAPELADLLHHITRRLQDHQRQLHLHHHIHRYHHSKNDHQGRGGRRHLVTYPAYQDGFAYRRSGHNNEGPSAVPQRLLRSDLGSGGRRRDGINPMCRGYVRTDIKTSLQLHNEVVNPRALASLLWALHSEAGPVHSGGAADTADTRSARHRARRLASRRRATAGGHAPVAGLTGSWCGDMAFSGPADGLGSGTQSPTLLDQYPELFRSAAAFLAQRASSLPPAALLQLLQIMAFSRPPGRLVCPALVDAFDRLVEVRPRWLIRTEGQARRVLECYRRMRWWPVGQVEEIGRRLEELNQATWRHKQ